MPEKKRRLKWPRYYRLDAENRVIEVRGALEWAKWFEHANRVVGWTQVTSEITVSTVFLGMDHRHFGDGPPTVFETMIFGGPESVDRFMWRYSSWDDAETGHKAAVKKARAAIKQKVKS